MRIGDCKECGKVVQLDEKHKVEGHDVWECGECGHPHAEYEFFNLRLQGADTVEELIEQLKAYPPKTKVVGYWEGITRDIQNIVLRLDGRLFLDVDDSPSTLEYE